jgi:Mg2+ and Co2+ transporter CorA
MSALSREVYGRMVTIEAFGPGVGRKLMKDAVDQFHHLSVMADGQKDYLQGTIEFYQARTNTKMTVAAERLAVIAAVTLPITAIASIEGMNMIVAVRENFVELTVVLTIMAVMSFWVLRWARRQGWW